METKLIMKSIYELLGMDFYIPSYQRGYRWKQEQVKALLEHIWEFVIDENIHSEFYCLQPIIVKQTQNNKWEVIDGQQRLTTIYIILKFFMKEFLRTDSLQSEYGKELFILEYKTREKSQQFLEELGDISEYNPKGNIDFHHIHSAYQTVANWCNENLKKRSDKDDFLKVLLGEKNEKKSVQVIWYEIATVDNSLTSYDLFSRMNIGKIGLTNAELAKALFLRQWDVGREEDYFKQRQIRLATEWDIIETSLQNDMFWAFFVTHQAHKSVG